MHEKPVLFALTFEVWLHIVPLSFQKDLFVDIMLDGTTHLPIHRSWNCLFFPYSVLWGPALVVTISPICLCAAQELSGRLSTARVQAVYKLSRVYMPLCVHWWDLFYLFFAAMIRKPSPIIRLLHPQAAQIWMFDMYEHSFLSHRSPTEWELNSGSITFSHKWTVTPHSMYTHRHVNPHMPRFWGKNTLRKKNSSSISC